MPAILHPTRRISLLVVAIVVIATFAGPSNVALAQRSDSSRVPNVLAGEVDNSALKQLFIRHGEQAAELSGALTATRIMEQLADLPDNKMARPVVAVPTTDGVYESMVKSSLVIGFVMECDNCPRNHAFVQAGGVIVSSDGIAITNYHVLANENEKAEQAVAMTYDGKCFPITRIVAASKRDDIIVFQIGGDTVAGGFHPSPLASIRPGPLARVRVLSHPHDEFFVLTEGVVSRYSRFGSRRGREEWMEITADFGAGSSGSGVFNSRGEVIGLVSRIQPLVQKRTFRETTDDDQQGELRSGSVEELILRRCVPLDAIAAQFAEPKEVLTAENSTENSAERAVLVSQ